MSSQTGVTCRNGKAERVTVRNVPSFVDRLDAMLEVDGLGTLKVDTAYGGDSFVIVDAEALGFSLVADEALQVIRRNAGLSMTRAARRQGAPDLRTLSAWESRGADAAASSRLPAGMISLPLLRLV